MQEKKAKRIRQQQIFSGFFEYGDRFSRIIELHSYIIPNDKKIEKQLTWEEGRASLATILVRRLSESSDVECVLLIGT